MAGFFKEFLQEVGSDLPHWENKESYTVHLQESIQDGRDACALGAEECGMQGSVESFSLVGMLLEGRTFDCRVRIKASCENSSGCPNPGLLLATLGNAMCTGDILYDLGTVSSSGAKK